MADANTNSAQSAVPKTELSRLDIPKAVKYLQDNAAAESQSRCARSIRLAIEAGGVSLKSHPINAKDYGPTLEAAGFTKVSTETFKAGDIVVIQSYTGGHSAGHITMYDGQAWLSDFKQRDMWSGPGYRKNKPDYAIYRP